MRQSLSDSVIVAQGLVKRFGRTRALDGLDLVVRSGEVHGFLGPNGAGKSTTIRALLGQLRLDGGRLEVFGLDPLHDAVRIHGDLAYVPGDTVLWPGLTGGECIDLLARFQGRRDVRRRDELIERFELDPTKRARTYSKGNRQKVALVAALSSGAPLLVLDEPTSGLDPLMEEAFQATIRELRADGTTVLLSSHILDEVEELCDMVTIIRAGLTVSTGSLDDLRAGTRTTIRATTPAPITGLDGYAATVESVGGLVHTTLSVGRDEVARAVTAVAAADPSALVVRPPSLDELFLGHYGESA
ncbi:ABC transporter ATP-binding protein [Actinomycetota bacterium]